MRFKLVVHPDGRSMLTTEELLTREQVDTIRELFRLWWERNDVIVMAETKVVQITEVELDMPEVEQ